MRLCFPTVGLGALSERPNRMSFRHLCYIRLRSPLLDRELTARADVGFAQDVILKRCIATPTRGSYAHVVCGEWSYPQVACHSLARGQSHTLTSLLGQAVHQLPLSLVRATDSDFGPRRSVDS